MKTEKSGWPSDVKTDAEKLEFIRMYEEKEGIQLDPNEIEFNTGLRQQAKLMLNSFWGKVKKTFHTHTLCFFQFGQRTNMMKTKMVKNAGQLWDILSEPGNEVHTIIEMTGEMLLVRYQSIEYEFEDIISNTNVVIAAFTTAHARLKLYSYMEKLGERVMYTDTGNLIFPSISFFVFSLSFRFDHLHDETRR